MPIPIQCPNCGRQAAVDDRMAGQAVACGACGNPVPVVGAVHPPSRSGGKNWTLITLLVLGLMCVMCAVPAVVLALLGTAVTIPAVAAAQDAATRATCQNNLKQLALAMHMYNDKYGQFPPAYTVDANGNRLHSWRVTLLPFMDQQALYDQIHHDEPWDSPHNQQFHQQMPPMFGCAATSGHGHGAPGETQYLVIVGPQTLFPPDGSKVTFADVTDGTSNTLMIAEASGSGVNWMKPADLDAATLSPAVNGGPTSIRSDHANGANIALADGSVRFVANETDPTAVPTLATRNGGDVVPPF